MGALLFLPFLLVGPIRRVLEEESNLKNGVLILALAVPASSLAWLFTGFGHGWIGGSLSLLGAVVALTYSFLFCTAAENTR